VVTADAKVLVDKGDGILSTLDALFSGFMVCIERAADAFRFLYSALG
jgi:hypothetical protein